MADGNLSLSLGPRLGVATKRCKRCRKTKPLREFHWRPEQMRHRAECKDCYRAARTARRDPEDNRRRVKKWQKENPEKRRAQTRRTYERQRLDLRRAIAKTLGTTRANCKRRSIEVTITAADVIELYNSQSGHCALTGRALIWGAKGVQRDTLSIDRVDQAGGYIPANIRLVTYQANMARGPYSDDELFAFCEAVLATRG